MRDQRGQALLEFALVFLGLYLVMSATIEFGRLFFIAQMLQDVARAGARELALAPLPASATFEQGVAATTDRVFDPSQLSIDLAAFPNPGDLDTHFASLPLVNRMLRPAMIFETLTVEGNDCRLLRYPGALLRQAGATGCDFTVGIPRVTARGVDGVETIEWLPVVEEVRPDAADPATGPFSVTSAGPERGLVALRINYPYQAAMLSGFQGNPAGFAEPNLSFRIVADDGAVTELAAPPGGAAILPDDGRAGTYAGSFGLGSQLAFAQDLRPFRKLISGQAMFRREVFQ